MKIFFRCFAAVLIFAFLATGASAASSISGSKGVAIDGYDPVAYFTQGEPQQGSAEFSTEWNGTTWHFSSAAHRDLFVQSPEKYAPQYGGHCAYAMAGGGRAAGDGERWRIVDDKLYLNSNWFAYKLWQGDVPGNIRDADKQWPQVKPKIETGT